MTAVVTSQHAALATMAMVSQMAPIQDLSSQTTIKEEAEETSRGRRRSRAQDASKHGDKSNGADGDGNSSEGEGPSRKRRRSRKGLEKKFECSAEGCGKSYSRAEHLYRHQLNHTPKQIYSCDFPDCQRTFVRQDLCTRHKERHTAKGSQLQRKDSMLNNSTVSNGLKSLQLTGAASSPESSRGGNAGKTRNTQLQYPSPQEHSTPFSPLTNQPSSAFQTSTTPAIDFNAYPQGNDFRRTNSDHALAVSQDMSHPLGPAKAEIRHQSLGDLDTTIHTSAPLHSAPYTPVSQDYQQLQTVNKVNFINQHNFTPFTLPPSGYASTAGKSPTETGGTFANQSITATTEFQREGIPGQQSEADMMLLDQLTAPANIMPVFGGEGYSRSPFAIPDDFVAYLFNGQNYESPIVASNTNSQAYAHFLEAHNQYQQSYYGNDVPLGGFFPQTQPHHPMSVTSLIDTNLPESVLSDEKSQEIVNLIKERFNETDHAPVTKHKETLFEGDRSNDSHMMSRKMMQTYIGSYWYHFHPQLPILHKPTFSPENTPNLLLIAMMTIGASCLDKTHGHNVTQAGAELSNFLAWHLRWEIFSDVDFRPPAKLWIFQALLLLELYEKMYSTRALHERAHIHHATTITLMRRGSSLIGRSALDSPPSVRDDKHGVNSSRHSSASGVNTPDEWWNHWITNEATRRAAFAAFVIDSTHATMFGHSTVMVAHEMRLPLPCDESLWSATSGTEVGRLESNLLANGVKPVSFLEGLKRTLNGQGVRTNSFGRTILMSGLLSVSWHMNQRDLQVFSLGVSQALGGRDKWKGTLTRSFDLWKQDYDKSLEPHSTSGHFSYMPKPVDDTVFESRTVLHHLAHMAMHVDIVDCQIFARAKRLLGRAIAPQDLTSTQRKMKDNWAPSAKARDATYYALHFLCTALLPHGNSVSGYDFMEQPVFTYSARDDVLLNRPWVLYFATLVIWSYAFALEGPTADPLPPNVSYEDQLRDMYAYLRAMEAVRSPEELKNMRGLNRCTGLLMVLRSTFEKTRWELLHEGANLLTNCIHLIGGTQ